MQKSPSTQPAKNLQLLSVGESKRKGLSLPWNSSFLPAQPAVGLPPGCPGLLWGLEQAVVRGAARCSGLELLPGQQGCTGSGNCKGGQEATRAAQGRSWEAFIGQTCLTFCANQETWETGYLFPHVAISHSTGQGDVRQSDIFLNGEWHLGSKNRSHFQKRHLCSLYFMHRNEAQTII